MRIAILGGTGRTGRRLIDEALVEGHTPRVLSRQAFDHPGAEVVRGDALDPERLHTLVRGTDAVVCLLGPDPAGPPDVCSRSTTLLIAAMKDEGVRRLVVQTGAMVGHPALGRFYRWLARRPGVRASLDERRAQEDAVRQSGLDWTIVRPPRLTNGHGTGAARVGEAIPIHPLASIARTDLGEVLLAATARADWVGTGVTALPAFTARHPGPLLSRWILRMGLAELLGIAAAAAIAVGFQSRFGEPRTLPAALAFYACMIGAGAIEGALLGHLPGTLLVRCFPHLSVPAFRRNTMLVAVGAWALGMLPSTLMYAQTADAPQAAGPPAWLIGAVGILGGAVGGAVIGLAQFFALRQVVPRAGRWVAATAIGWALALPLDLFAGTLPEPGDPLLRTIATAAGLGLAAGVLVAVPTGVLLVRLLRERVSPSPTAPHGPPRAAPPEPGTPSS